MKNILYLLPFLMVFWSCDEYTSKHQAYIENGEIIYSVKVDSVLSYPGRDRINIKAGFASAPHIKKIKIEWDEGEGSQTWDVNGSNDSVFYEFLITDLEEKSYIFSLYSLDSEGNRSIRVDEFASVYGSKYEATLKNRSINDLELNSDSVVFNWATAPNGLIYTDLTYTTTEGSAGEVRIPADSSQTVLNDCDYQVKLKYKSSFLPDTLAIDTFYCAETEVSLSNYPYELGKGDWTVESYSSQVATQPVTNAIDGDYDTYWESLSDADRQLGHQRYFSVSKLRDIANECGLKVLSEEGLFLKALTTGQLESLKLSDNVFEGFMQLGIDYPELSAGFLVELTHE